MLLLKSKYIQDITKNIQLFQSYNPVIVLVRANHSNQNVKSKGCGYHSKNSHEANGYGILFDSLRDQIHQQHQHVIDALMNLCPPLVHCTRRQQLQQHLTSELLISSHLVVYNHFQQTPGRAYAFTCLLIQTHTNLFEGLGHAAVNEPLTVLICISQAQREETRFQMCHFFLEYTNMQTRT